MPNQLGDDCIPRDSWAGAYNGTFLLPWWTFPVGGTVVLWDVFAKSAATYKLKVFRDDGTNYVFVGETGSVSVSAGLNTDLSANITVQSGDFIGVYMGSDAGPELTDAGSNTYYTKAGDVSSNTPKTDWSGSTHGAWSLKYFYNSDIYIKLAGDDTDTGVSWATAKKNVREGVNSVATGFDLHVGFEDYSAQPGIQFDMTMDLICETVGSSGGTGTTTLPNTAWAQCDFSSSILDRGNIASDTFSEYNYITIPIARAQRFVPKFRCLKKVILKMKRRLDVDLYVEIRNDNSGVPQGNPQAATGQVAYVTVPYTSVSALALSEVPVTFDVDLGSLNPFWIVVSLSTYDPNSGSGDIYYDIDGDTAGSASEYLGSKTQNYAWVQGTGYNLYFKTHRGI